ncbi:MAG: biotin-(acetyl-CoA-carboxylase) ligase [Planctomycetota bacterium]|nr:MAG: biotin-(acetyl-CoA-carboxylase) ligase [Planctomycetota bacterium]
MTAPLDAASVLRGLRPHRIPSKLVCLDEILSTNDVCWERERAGEPEGLTVTAESQTAGRGRFGRAWHSPRGLSLAVSVLLRPALPAERLPLLTAAAAVAACEAAGPEARIRWPNDVVLKGRKVAGVIVEGRPSARSAPNAESGAFVLGCGLNVNLRAADFPDDLRDTSTSLLIETGEAHDRGAVLRTFLDSLDARYDEALSGDSALPSAWRELSALMGERVSIMEAAKEYRGEVADLDVLEGISVRLEGAVRRFRLEHVERLRILK